MGFGKRITNVIGIDLEHLDELRVSSQSWRAYKPQEIERPTLFVCDGSQGTEQDWIQRLKWYDSVDKRVITFDDKYLRGVGATQREVMLTAITYALTLVETDWWVKIDTDTVANGAGEWIESEWLSSNLAFVSHRWSYTKPAAFIKQLDGWSLSVPELRRNQRPAIELPDDLSQRVGHARIQSIVMLGRRSFARTVWGMIERGDELRMPCPSQDTLMWYVAERMKFKYEAINLKRRGWAHGRGAMREWTGKT